MGRASSRAPQNAPLKRVKRRLAAPSAGSRNTEVYCSHSGALTDNQREEGSLMKPSASDTDTDTARAERVEHWRAQQAEIRALVDVHAALAREFRALHEQAQALQTQDDMSRAERRAQKTAPPRPPGRRPAPAPH